MRKRTVLLSVLCLFMLTACGGSELPSPQPTASSTAKISVDEFTEAAYQGVPATVVRYIDQGGDINAKNSKGTTALMLAAAKTRTGIMKYLMKHGAQKDIGMPDSGLTAMMIAAANNLTVSVKVLLENGANVNQRDNNGNTALMYANETGNPELINLLKKYGATD